MTNKVKKNLKDGIELDKSKWTQYSAVKIIV